MNLSCSFQVLVEGKSLALYWDGTSREFTISAGGDLRLDVVGMQAICVALNKYLTLVHDLEGVVEYWEREGEKAAEGAGEV